MTVQIYEGPLSEDGTRKVSLELSVASDVEEGEAKKIHTEITELLQGVGVAYETVDRQPTPMKIWLELTKQLFLQKTEVVQAKPEEVVEPETIVEEAAEAEESTVEREALGAE